jgi:hypothetical protein
MATYECCEFFIRAPFRSPNPSDVDVIVMTISWPQSEQFFFISIVDFSGLAAKIFLSIFTIGDHLFSLNKSESSEPTALIF